MSGHIAHQISLVSTLAAYQSAERAAEMFPEVRDQWAKADQLHAELTRICLACGFTPGSEHRNVSVVQFATRRAEQLQRIFPTNLKEKGL